MKGSLWWWTTNSTLSIYEKQPPSQGVHSPDSFPLACLMCSTEPCFKNMYTLSVQQDRRSAGSFSLKHGLVGGVVSAGARWCRTAGLLSVCPVSTAITAAVICSCWILWNPSGVIEKNSVLVDISEASALKQLNCTRQVIQTNKLISLIPERFWLIDWQSVQQKKRPMFKCLLSWFFKKICNYKYTYIHSLCICLNVV